MTGKLEGGDSGGEGGHPSSRMNLVPPTTAHGKRKVDEGRAALTPLSAADPSVELRRYFKDEKRAKEGGFLVSPCSYLCVAPVVLSRQIVCQNLKVNICLWGWWGIQRSLLFLSSQRRHNGAWFR